jgi:hydroxyethylthiazole kinase
MEQRVLTDELTPRDVWARVRSAAPLVHNITNSVVTNWTANVLLAVGASPAMVHAPEEVEEFVSISRALVINIGTLDEVFLSGMRLAAAKAQQRSVPWVLDPVGVGATAYRRAAVKELLAFRPAVIRGNAAEIMTLAGEQGAQARGVDSLRGSEAAVSAAQSLADRTGAVVAVTGATDYIVSAAGVVAVKGGHPLSQRVTGTGCAATALVGACLAVASPEAAAVAALTGLKRAAETAAGFADEPGSFAVKLIDALAVWPPVS